MLLLKKAIGWVVLSSYVVFSIIFISVIFGWVKLPEHMVVPLAGVLISEVLGGVVALAKAESFFDDPEAVAQLKQEHANHMRETVKRHSKAMVDMQEAHRAEILSLDARQREKVAELKAQHDSAMRMEREVAIRRLAASNFAGLGQADGNARG